MRLPFTLDPQVIHHIIHSQAGSIGKALIELIMNSVDAQAGRLDLVVTQDGFSAQDNGKGFASREDIVQYFGRFGTPHEEGDATFGRFRLGRGQIMAHAVTVWQSQRWQMTVDTQTMGYSYDLEDLATPFPGCSIAGTWYESLGEMELYEVLQELRDLVRYTPLEVFLNGKKITRDPSKEMWQHEDEVAYYRFHKEGSVAIYNQGVLVRHDPGAHWGAGGLIVSKKAIGLNVSRTEILRKTCAVWKAIAQQGKVLAKEFAEDTTLRKGENARALAARQMKVATGKALEALVTGEAVFTTLPGTRHLTLAKLLNAGVPVTVMATNEHWGLMQKGEAIAYSRQAMVLHPRTAERFECADAAELEQMIGDIFERLERHASTGGMISWEARRLLQNGPPTFLPFSALAASFRQSSQVIPDQRLPAHLRRQWTALKWCLENYASLVSSPEAQRYGCGQVFGHARRFHVVLGESTVADAWTDGQSYIAIHRKEVEKLKSEGLRAAQRIFALVDHELAHAGDSLDATHDEAFFNRYHDLTLEHAHNKQFYLQQFTRKYMASVERGKPAGWARRESTVESRIQKAEGPASLVANPAEGYPQRDSEPLSDVVMARINASLGGGGPAWEEQELERQIALEAKRKAESKAEDERLDALYAQLEEDSAAWEPEEEDYPEMSEEHFDAMVEAEDQAQCQLARESADRGEYWLVGYQGLAPIEEALGRAPTQEEIEAIESIYNTFLVAHFIRSQGRFPAVHDGQNEAYAWARAGQAQSHRPLSWIIEQRRASAVGLPLEDYLLSKREEDSDPDVVS